MKKRLQMSLLGGFLILSPCLWANSHHDHSHDHNQPHGHFEQKAHEHGVAQMQFVIAENEVLIEISSPLYNLLGFEHKPKLAEQKQAVERQLSNIQSGKLISFNQQSECKLTELLYTDHPFMNEDERHLPTTHSQQKVQGQDPHQNRHKGHKDIAFEYEMHCQYPHKLTHLDTGPLFSAWHNLQTLRVQWVYKNRQSAATVTRSNTIIHLPK